jgi:hypothetical protein
MSISMLSMTESLSSNRSHGRYPTSHRPMAISSITSPPFSSASLSNKKHSEYRHIGSLLERSPPPSLGASSPESASNSSTGSPSPISLHERRQRNKAASAKYRQKKNQQHGEMRSIIGHLTEENALLTRQVEELKRENQMVRATCDQLRGKIVASKMLKRMMKAENEEPTRTKRRRSNGQFLDDSVSAGYPSDNDST